MTHTIEPPPAVPAGEPLPPQVDKLIADLETHLPQGEVPAGIFGHPQVYQTELRKVFGRCWVYLAHDSEIAANGDYVVRKIGEDNFIVSRDDSVTAPSTERITSPTSSSPQLRGGCNGLVT